MTNVATGWIGRIDHGGEVTDATHETYNLVRDARRGRGANDARQLRSHVDLVRHYLEIQRIACVGILVLRLVAEDTHLHALGEAAMESQLVVAGIAAFGSGNVAR